MKNLSSPCDTYRNGGTLYFRTQYKSAAYIQLPIPTRVRWLRSQLLRFRRTEYTAFALNLALCNPDIGSRSAYRIYARVLARPFPSSGFSPQAERTEKPQTNADTTAKIFVTFFILSSIIYFYILIILNKLFFQSFTA